MAIRILLVTGLLLAGATVQAQERFRSPEAAVDALKKALAADDQRALDRLFGPEYKAFHDEQQADAALSKLRREMFARDVKEFTSLSPAGDDKRVLYIGSSGTPFPGPIVKSRGRWAFDGKAGVEELRNRIVGSNELNAIATLDAYAGAQREYAAEDQDGDGVAEFAQKFASSADKHDGLYWEDDPDDPSGVMSPLGPLVALAELAMGQRQAGTPFLGYHFRILTSQGAGAKGGPNNYVVNGHMVGGFGAVAWPANYGDTGIKTFVVNQDGVVYEADFGEKTAETAAAIASFDPGAGWSAVDDDNLLGEKETAAR